MGRKQIITREILEPLAHLGVTEAARRLGVSRRCVSNAAKRIGVTMTDVRGERARALHADPEFAEAHRQRMRARNADPERNPLVRLTPEERAEYDVLKSYGYTRSEALRGIGRADLVREGDA